MKKAEAIDINRSRVVSELNAMICNPDVFSEIQQRRNEENCRKISWRKKLFNPL